MSRESFARDNETLRVWADTPDSPHLRRLGGAIPTERILPMVEAAVREQIRADKSAYWRYSHRLYRIKRRRYVSLALVDKLLVDLGIEDAWHGELADLYEAA